MNIRLIEDIEKDLTLVESWWKGHKHPFVPAFALPDIGVFVEDEGNPLCVGWLYECNSAPVAWLEWITTNPKNSNFESAKSIRILVDFMILEAEKNGYAIVLSTCRQAALGRIMEKSGFVKTDDGVSHYLRITNLVKGN